MFMSLLRGWLPHGNNPRPEKATSSGKTTTRLWTANDRKDKIIESLMEQNKMLTDMLNKKKGGR